MNPLPFAVAALLIATPAVASAAGCEDSAQDSKADRGLACAQLDPITIFGRAQSARDVAGGASAITAEDLDQFETTDVVRALRRVPGVALTPNSHSIERSITELRADSVAIASKPKPR